MKYIIAKYAHEITQPDVGQSVRFTHSANECGITKETYDSLDEAQNDLNKLIEFNPSVSYGILKLPE